MGRREGRERGRENKGKGGEGTGLDPHNVIDRSAPLLYTDYFKA
jgi:hypothetical protein